MNNFIDLDEWNRTGVFAFIDARGSNIYISHSNNMLKSMVRLLDRFSTYEPIILETCNDSFNGRQLLVQKYMEKYKTVNFSVLNKKSSLKYKVNIEIVNEQPFVVHVVLKSRKSKKVVGIFKKYKDAIKFLETFYNGDITKIIYASNELTRTYRSSPR
jgi:hypothetical protein